MPFPGGINRHTTMKATTTIQLATFGLLATFGNAATLRYNGSGDWNNVSNNDSGWGLNPNNPPVSNGSLPTTADTARINFGNNTVTVTSNVPDVGQIQIGVDESGSLIVASGGVLETTGQVRVGNNGSSVTAGLTVQNGGSLTVGGILWSSTGGVNAAVGNITIDAGGTVEVGDHLWLGINRPSVINIAGSLTQTGGILGLGTSNASTPSGGSATLTVLSGGLLALNNISGGAATPSIQPGSVLDIEGTGRLTLPGDFTGVINNYIAANKITGNGNTGPGSVAAVFVGGQTVVTAIPEPSSTFLVGLAGILVLARRKR